MSFCGPFGSFAREKCFLWVVPEVDLRRQNLEQQNQITTLEARFNELMANSNNIFAMFNVVNSVLTPEVKLAADAKWAQTQAVASQAEASQVAARPYPAAGQAPLAARPCPAAVERPCPAVDQAFRAAVARPFLACLAGALTCL